MKIEDVTPEAVVNAYVETDLKAAQMAWYSKKSRCACGLSALAIQHKPALKDDFIDGGVIEGVLDLPQIFTIPFVYGFDGNHHFNEIDPELQNREYYDLGRKCWAAVKEAGLAWADEK